MKLPPFDLAAPRTLTQALALLGDRERDSMPLAGGQTLLPLLASGAVEARMLVDLGRIDRAEGLHGFVTQDGELRIGALVTHAELARAAPYRVLRDAAYRIGTAAVRTRGTIGGSLAAAAPSAEWCVIAIALDAAVHLAAAEGARRIRAGSLFSAAADGPRPGELITAMSMRGPELAGIAGHRDRVDGTATVAIAALVDLDGGARELRVAVGGIGSAPELSRLTLEEADSEPHGVSRGAAQEVVQRLDSLSESDGLVGALASRAVERMSA